MDYKKRDELINKLDEVDELIREGISSYDTTCWGREKLKTARGHLQECITAILSIR